MAEHSICIFGDSITWGAGDPEKGGWAQRLKSYFETRDSEYIFYFYSLGIPGDNTQELLTRFEEEAKAREPSLIIFSIGLNDSQYIETKDNPRVSKTDFSHNIKTLIEQSQKLHAQIVFLGLPNVDEELTTPIGWSNIKKFYENSVIHEYDEILKALTDEQKLGYIPIFDTLNKADLADGLHPNPIGHEKMFNQVLKYLLANKYLPEPK